MDGVSVGFEAGLVHSILGPNGRGKSTPLKALSRQLQAGSGAVYVDGRDAREWKPKPFARHLAMLMQSQERSTDIRVYDLVSYGRFPHKGLMQRLDDQDRRIVDWALDLTGASAFSERGIQELSGGERQLSPHRYGAGAAAESAAPGRADHLPGHLLSAGDYGAGGAFEQGAGHDGHHGASRSEPCGGLLGPDHRHERGAVYSQGEPESVICEKMLRDVFRVEASIVREEATGGRPAIASMRPPPEAK
ncbi:ABC transporter ATP-binding protein [Paenibacillus sp. P26]|nr:ABC transporter ATP-binding protein [Paenibacillus sp. P26]